VPFTPGFSSWSLYAFHYDKHVIRLREFGPLDPRSYLLLADAFCGGPLDRATTLECVRSHGDRVRYNRVTLEYGISAKTGEIRTYFRLGVGQPLRPEFKTNEDYFWWSCKQF
jgi:hypothetical protein